MQVHVTQQSLGLNVVEIFLVTLYANLIHLEGKQKSNIEMLHSIVFVAMVQIAADNNRDEESFHNF